MEEANAATQGAVVQGRQSIAKESIPPNYLRLDAKQSIVIARNG